MVPTPAQILEVVKLALQCLLAFLQWVQTDDGKAWVKQVTSDRAKWDSFWADAGKGLTDFFSGKLFT